MSGPEKRDRYIDAFLEEWIAWEEHQGITWPLPDDIVKQLDRWHYNYRVPLGEIVDAVQIAWCSTADDPLMYFYGVVWNKIRVATSRGWDA